MKLLTALDVAKLLHVTLYAVGQWRRRGVGPAYTTDDEDGNLKMPRVRYLRKDVLDWAASHRKLLQAERDGGIKVATDFKGAGGQ